MKTLTAVHANTINGINTINTIDTINSMSSVKRGWEINGGICTIVLMLLILLMFLILFILFILLMLLILSICVDLRRGPNEASRSISRHLLYGLYSTRVLLILGYKITFRRTKESGNCGRLSVNCRSFIFMNSTLL